MTTFIFPGYAESCLDSSAPNLSSVNVKIAALDTVIASPSAADNYDDISGTVIANTANLGTKTITDGTFGAASTSLGSPAGGDEIVALVAYHDTGTPSTSRLLAYTDVDVGGTTISILTDGNEILINVDSVLGLFRLGTG